MYSKLGGTSWSVCKTVELKEPSAIVSLKVASEVEEQLSSSSVTSPVSETLLVSISHSTVILSGAVKVGAVVSIIVIV